MAHSLSSEYVVKNVMVLKKDTCSVRELLAWVNETMQTEIRELSELKTGGIYCQFIHKLFPSSISLNKVHLFTNAAFEIDANFKLLHSIFAKLNIRKEIPHRELVKGRGHYEFLNWMKKFHDINDNGQPYDAISERKGKPIGLRRVMETEKQRPIGHDYSSCLRRSTTIVSSSPDSKPVQLAPRAQSFLGISGIKSSKKLKVTPIKKKSARKIKLFNGIHELANESPIIDNGGMVTKLFPDAPEQSQPAIDADESKTEPIPKKSYKPKFIRPKSIPLVGPKISGESDGIQNTIVSEYMLPSCGSSQTVHECFQINTKPLAHSTPKISQKIGSELLAKVLSFPTYETAGEPNVQNLEEPPCSPILENQEKLIIPVEEAPPAEPVASKAIPESDMLSIELNNDSVQSLSLIQETETPPGEPVASKAISLSNNTVSAESNNDLVQPLSDKITNAAPKCDTCERDDCYCEKSVNISKLKTVPTLPIAPSENYFSFDTLMAMHDLNWGIEADEHTSSKSSIRNGHNTFINSISDHIFMSIMQINEPTPVKSVVEQSSTKSPEVLEPSSTNVIELAAPDIPSPSIRTSGPTVVKKPNTATSKNCSYSNSGFSKLPIDTDSEDEKDDQIWAVRRQIVILKDKLTTIESILMKYCWSSNRAIHKLNRYLRKQKLDEPFLLGNLQK